MSNVSMEIPDTMACDISLPFSGLSSLPQLIPHAEGVAPAVPIAWNSAAYLLPPCCWCLPALLHTHSQLDPISLCPGSDAELWKVCVHRGAGEVAPCWG